MVTNFDFVNDGIFQELASYYHHLQQREKVTSKKYKRIMFRIRKSHCIT